MLETIAIEYANTKEQEFACHAIFSCLSKSYDILNSTSEFTFFFWFLFQTTSNRVFD